MPATVTAKIRPIKATLHGIVTLSDLAPAESYVISGEGKGGAAGLTAGSAKVALAEHDDGTLLSYVVDVNIGGKLGQLGGRLIKSIAKRLSAKFFESFAKEIAA